VLELRREFALADLLDAAKLPRSTFYYQAKALAVPDRHDELKTKIRAVYAEHHGLYGYRRVTAAIRRDGWLVNHKTVQRLMSDMGMKSRVRPEKVSVLWGEIGQAAPNSLNREFTASQANQKWVTDVTEFSVAGKKLYLSPVMDLYNGEIVAYETSRRPDFSLVMGMLKKAARKCTGMDGLLLHSDSNNVSAGYSWVSKFFVALVGQRRAGAVQRSGRPDPHSDRQHNLSFPGPVGCPATFHGEVSPRRYM
jgi:hypothetical protein